VPEENQLPDDIRRLGDLLAYPHEDLAIELKEWLDFSSEEHRADLAKAILALANHGGGTVVLGFSDQGGQWVPTEPLPHNLTVYSQDAINGIA